MDVLFDEEEFDLLGDAFAANLEFGFRLRLVPGATPSLSDDHHSSLADIMFVPYSASGAAEDNFAVNGFFFSCCGHSTILHEPSHMNQDEPTPMLCQIIQKESVLFV